MSRTLLIFLSLFLVSGCAATQTTRFSSNFLSPATTMKIGSSIDQLGAKVFNWGIGGIPGDFSVKFDAKVTPQDAYIETTRSFKSRKTK